MEVEKLLDGGNSCAPAPGLLECPLLCGDLRAAASSVGTEGRVRFEVDERPRAGNYSSYLGGESGLVPNLVLPQDLSCARRTVP